MGVESGLLALAPEAYCLGVLTHGACVLEGGQSWADDKHKEEGCGAGWRGGGGGVVGSVEGGSVYSF